MPRTSAPSNPAFTLAGATPTAEALFAQLDQPFTGEALFDQLPDIVYFVKDRLGRYVSVNRTLVQRCGLRDKSQLIGRTAQELLGASLGETFTVQDRRVIRSGKPLLRQLELHVYPSRDVGWCLTTKLPLRNRRGTVIGLVGVSQDLRLPDASTSEYRPVAAAVAYAEAHLGDPPSVGDLAAVARLSRYQLDRRMTQVFGLTTGQWLLRLRIDFAQRQLRQTTRSVATIAAAAGYEDQSAFARQFQRSTGLAPTAYRHGGMV